MTNLLFSFFRTQQSIAVSFLSGCFLSCSNRSMVGPPHVLLGCIPRPRLCESDAVQSFIMTMELGSLKRVPISVLALSSTWLRQRSSPVPTPLHQYLVRKRPPWPWHLTRSLHYITGIGPEKSPLKALRSFAILLALFPAPTYPSTYCVGLLSGDQHNIRRRGVAHVRGQYVWWFLVCAAIWLSKWPLCPKSKVF